ncbi:MAG: hypothetical protein FJ276_36210 [Planctomycetes bacterium]|nr:hypothetical protein [Planctomycetota bacterium]
MVGPSEKAEFCVLLAGMNTNRQNVPAKRVLYAGTRVVHQHTCIDTAEPALSLEKEGEILPIRLRLDFQKAGQALLVKQPGRKCVGAGEAAQRVTRPSWRPP